jgi:hypothetical protein
MNSMKLQRIITTCISHRLQYAFYLNAAGQINVCCCTVNLAPCFAIHRILVKGKAAPLQAWTGPEASRKLSFPDFMTTAQDGSKVVSLMNRPPLPPGNAPGTHLCWRLSRPQGHSAIGRILCQWKIPITPAWIEPATFRFVSQHLNHCATAVRCHVVLSLKITYTVPLIISSNTSQRKKILAILFLTWLN